MGQPWENPNYRNNRRLRLALLPLLVAAAAAAFLLLQRTAPEKVDEAAAKPPPTRLAAPADSLTRQGPRPPEESGGENPPAAMPPGDDSRGGASAARQWADALFVAGKFDEALAAYRRLAPPEASSRGRAGICLARLSRWEEAADELQAALDLQPDDFAARKELAQALYRQNELKPALEQVQAALALRMDDDLLELQARLQREIRVQRNYDNARTANFVVLFDGYEHEEMKHTVLGIVKDAYAEIGKELDHFPEKPITVILYTAKDFSDVTRAPGWAGGMFGKVDGKIRVPVHGAEGQEVALGRVLTHEYVHALLHSMAPGTPLWLHEGLTQYLSGDRAIHIGQMIPLELLVAGFPRDARAAYAAYMESLQAVTDLVDEHGMPPLRRLLKGLGDGRGLEAAFAAAYGEPFSRWAAQWRPVQREE